MAMLSANYLSLMAMISANYVSPMTMISANYLSLMTWRERFPEPPGSERNDKSRSTQSVCAEIIVISDKEFAEIIVISDKEFAEIIVISAPWCPRPAGRTPRGTS